MTRNDDDGKTAPLGPERLLRLSDFDARSPDRVAGALRDYWLSLRRGRAVPSRADVEPAGLRAALPFAFILERVAPGAARFRLAGRHLVDLMGMEVRGMPLCSVLNAPSRGRLSDVLEAVFKGPQIAELDLIGPVGYGRPALTGRMLLMPLKSDLGDVSRALGCLATEGEIGAAPRRFDIAADRAMPVVEGARVLTPQPSMHGFAEPPAPWRGEPFAPDDADSPASVPRRRPAAGRPPSLPTMPPLFDAPAPRPAIREDETPEERRARFRVISND
ncbi:PAS domain-containing protein [Paracoccus sanguinis]|uniref:PAS domain-containing protein n=1 Tax=Paracoccus sanguinis TaxID=1545044 RepID=UPI00068A702E|nr:PAS domain-containing protein [Paracoccus sanguinis]